MNLSSRLCTECEPADVVLRESHLVGGPHRKPTRSSIKLASSLAIIDGMRACMADAFYVVFSLDRTAAVSVCPLKLCSNCAHVQRGTLQTELERVMQGLVWMLQYCDRVCCLQLQPWALHVLTRAPKRRTAGIAACIVTVPSGAHRCDRRAVEMCHKLPGLRTTPAQNTAGAFPQKRDK